MKILTTKLWLLVTICVLGETILLASYTVDYTSFNFFLLLDMFEAMWIIWTFGIIGGKILHKPKPSKTEYSIEDTMDWNTIN